jgi:hypothetical protein
LDAGATPEWSEIVGIVGNVKSYSEATRDDPQVYEPFPQRAVPSFSIMIRANSDPNGLASALRNAVAQADADLPLARVMSMPALIERQKGGDPVFVRVLGTFAFLALILALDFAGRDENDGDRSGHRTGDGAATAEDF